MRCKMHYQILEVALKVGCFCNYIEKKVARKEGWAGDSFTVLEIAKENDTGHSCCSDEATEVLTRGNLAGIFKPNSNKVQSRSLWCCKGKALVVRRKFGKNSFTMDLRVRFEGVLSAAAEGGCW